MRQIAFACAIGVLCAPWLAGCRPAPVDPALSVCFAADNAVGDQMLKIKPVILAVDHDLGTVPGAYHDALVKALATCTPILRVLPINSWNPWRAQAAKDCKSALEKDVHNFQNLVSGVVDPETLSGLDKNLDKTLSCEEGGFLIGRLKGG